MDRSPAEHVSKDKLQEILERFSEKQLNDIGEQVQENLTRLKTSYTDVIYNRKEFTTELLCDRSTEKATRTLSSEALHKPGEHTSQLTRSYSSLEKRNETLRQNLQNLKSKNKEVLQRLYNTEQQLEESKEATQTFRLRAGKLGGYITKNATNANELLDSEIKGKLDLIQHKTLAIVKKYCVGDPRPLPRDDWSDFQDQSMRVRQILDQYKNEDPAVLHEFLIRGKIYKLLEEQIFDRPVFGLEEDLEEKLAELEGLLLKENRNSGSDIGEWRALTVRYAKSLSMKHTKLPARTASRIERLFDPWVIDHPLKSQSQKGYQTHKKSDQLRDDLYNLCQEAYNLAVMLRRSSDRYYFISIKDRKKVELEEEEYFRAESMIGPRSKYIGSEVWVTLFGALVKESQSGESYVIAKALVVCEAQSSRSKHAHGDQSPQSVRPQVARITGPDSGLVGNSASGYGPGLERPKSRPEPNVVRAPPRKLGWNLRYPGTPKYS